MVERIPIAVVYQLKNKTYVKQFTDIPTPDSLITKRSTKLPSDCEIIQIGVGSKFYKEYLSKYKK